jgi:hypothetical protein
MSKKILLTIVFVISGIILLNAQCTNIVYTTSGLHPDSVRHADATLLYGDTLTIIIPADTTISGIVVPIDSIVFTSITGMPAGFTATPSAHHWPFSSSGCIIIAGTPTHADALAQGGKYPIVINLYGYGKYMGAPVSTPLPAYTSDTLKIRNNSLGIPSIDVSKFDVAQNSPNPFSLKTAINYTSPNSENYQFIVYNVIGNIVYSQSIVTKPGMNTIEFSAANLSSGIYVYKLSNATQTITRRMMVEGK